MKCQTCGAADDSDHGHMMVMGAHGLEIGDRVDPRKTTLKTDAERLAELQAELRKSEQKDWAQGDVVSTRTQRLNALIAVYEECAARGIAFGSR